MRLPKQLIFIGTVIAVIGIISTLAAFSRRTFKKEGNHIPFTLTSPVFEHNSAIPSYYTCDEPKTNEGDPDISPPLAWQHPPAGTKSFVLICHDPDALGGQWIHWIVYDIPSDRVKLEEHVKADGINAKLALNSWGEATYGGPCPPLKQHRYVFTLYALDIPHLIVTEPADYAMVMQAMGDHILDKATLIGTYQRIKSI